MKKQVLTEFSGFANTLADTFRAAFRTAKVGEYTADMTAPEGSTHGGLHGLQHITLGPQAGLAIVVGTVHAGDQRSELRSYEFVNRVHEERFKKPVPFDATAYKEFLDKSEGVLSGFGITVTVTDAPRDNTPSFHPSLPPAADDDAPRGPRAIMIAGIIAGVVLVALALLIALR
jgi:hypothetical protein